MAVTENIGKLSRQTDLPQVWKLRQKGELDASDELGGSGKLTPETHLSTKRSTGMYRLRD